MAHHIHIHLHDGWAESVMMTHPPKLSHDERWVETATEKEQQETERRRAHDSGCRCHER